uniref:ENT domain-containing protein n=1 Tax=Steinernema glaseri TaxID=37863 RepID=A0A1I7Y2M4_9BILA
MSANERKKTICLIRTGHKITAPLPSTVNGTQPVRIRVLNEKTTEGMRYIALKKESSAQRRHVDDHSPEVVSKIYKLLRNANDESGTEANHELLLDEKDKLLTEVNGSQLKRILPTPSANLEKPAKKRVRRAAPPIPCSGQSILQPPSPAYKIAPDIRLIPISHQVAPGPSMIPEAPQYVLPPTPASLSPPSTSSAPPPRLYHRCITKQQMTQMMRRMNFEEQRLRTFINIYLSGDVALTRSLKEELDDFVRLVSAFKEDNESKCALLVPRYEAYEFDEVGRRYV